MNYLLITLMLLLQFNLMESEDKKEKLKIDVNFLDGKLKIDDNKMNFTISIENISENSFMLLDDFSYDLNIYICFESIETGAIFKIGSPVVKYDHGPDFKESYIVVQPKEKIVLKISQSEKTMKDFKLPKGKYKVKASYTSSKGKDCLKGHFLSSEVTAEKE